MRTDSPDFLPTPIARMLQGLSRARERIATFGLITRLLLLAALVGLVTAAGYVLSPEESGGMAWIYNEHRFSRDEVAQIGKILDAENIAWNSDKGRIEVKRQRVAEVHSVLDRRSLTPLGFGDVRGQAIAPSIFEAPADLEARRNRKREQELEVAIEEIDPSLEAVVQITRTRSRGLKPVEDLNIAVRLSAEGDREISPRTTEAIETLLFSFEPNLKPEGLSIIDRKARVYHSPTDSVVSHNSRARAREDELGGKIRDQLDWVKGIRVSVSIDPTAGGAAAKPHAQVPSAPEVIVNQPIGEVPAPTRTTTGVVGKAKVFIQIPASHIVERFRAFAPEKRPTPMDLEPLFAEARDRVEKVVKNVIPTAELGSLEVSRIDVTAPLSVSNNGTGSPTRLGRPVWLLSVVGGVAAASVIVAAAFGFWLAARRPSVRPSNVVRRPRLVTRASAGPAERVRELVRLDPAAAAGVLHRWIGQGGHAG